MGSIFDKERSLLTYLTQKKLSICHCEERSDEAISDYDNGCLILSEIAALISSAQADFIMLAMTENGLLREARDDDMMSKH